MLFFSHEEDAAPMPALDFREIPEANKSTGMQDTFELFARDVLEMLGFEIVQGPGRGPDLGKDLIVKETRPGIVGDTKVKWLVSCKHFAHSGDSVGPDDEKNVFERVSAAGCKGFMGFYSTIPSSGLSELLHRQTAIEIEFFDREKIERRLLSSAKGRRIAERYFPKSAKKLQHVPAELFADRVKIECERCGKNLLEPPSGIWVLWSRTETDSSSGEEIGRFVDLHFACKGECDQIVERMIRARHASGGFILDGWDDIPDLAVPTVFISKVMAFLNGLARGDKYEPEVFDKVKQLLLATFPLVSRHLSDADKLTLERLQRIPEYLGGMGRDD
jgi:hypothetical protein